MAPPAPHPEAGAGEAAGLVYQALLAPERPDASGPDARALGGVDERLRALCRCLRVDGVALLRVTSGGGEAGGGGAGGEIAALWAVARATAERLRRRARLLAARPPRDRGGVAALRTQHLGAALVLQLGWRDGDGAVVVALLRRGPAAAFAAADRAALASLRPHVARAMHLAAALGAVERRALRRAAAFEALPQPLVVADALAGVRAANLAARSLPRAAGVRLQRGGRLVAAAAADGAALGRALAATTDPLLRLPAATLALGPEGRTEAQLLALDSGDAAAAGRPPRRLALVALRVRRPRVAAPRPRGDGRRQGKITAAEDRLLRLVLAGCDAATAARRLGVALATVRTQLRSLYDKTGCRGRAALIARFAGAS